MKARRGDLGFGALIEKFGTEGDKAALTRPHKYHAKSSTVDGHFFPSQAEADRYGELKIAEKAGLIRNLQLQVPFKLVVNNVQVCRYIADFQYERYDHQSGLAQTVVEDVKGVRTESFAIKSRLMLACHGIVVIEHRKGKRR